jgi:nicotinate-nucleotide pyrophosphorylase (carboxylating)
MPPVRRPASSLASSPLIQAALREDLGPGDITSRSVVPAGLVVRARVVAKAAGVVAGLDAARAAFAAVDRRIVVAIQRPDGATVSAGKTLMEVEGPARAILSAERTALNLIGHLSGVATLTREFVERVRPYSVDILDTRKTLPGMRALQKAAVVAGGGSNHRLGLFDAVLIKTNHLIAMGLAVPGRSRETLVAEAVQRARARAPQRPVEIEVATVGEFRAALGVKPDAILLDNMTEAEIRQCVRVRDGAQTSRAKGPVLEVSGGVTLENVRKLAATGVDRISIGRLTHSVASLDVSLRIES